MAKKITFETMQPLLNEPFTLRPAGGLEVSGQLVEVSPTAQAGRPAFSWQKKEKNPDKKTSFSLVFRLPKEVGANQQMYDLSHTQLGDLGKIFLVPIAEDEDGLYLEAIFN